VHFIDRPTSHDRLGFQPYVEGIEDMLRQIISRHELPSAIGIYGAWGSGKTSFMMQLRDRLMKEMPHSKPIPTIWFDAWKYDRKQDVRSGLIYSILIELHDKARRSTKAKITNAIKTGGKFSALLVTQSQLSLGIPVAGMTIPSIEQLAKKITDNEQEFYTIVDKYTNVFAGAVKAFLDQYTEEETKALVVFIDDLDRCLPENVIIILEALKLFLENAPCIFVIGVDRTVVEKAVRVHYRDDPGIYGREYLDKIIQHQFTLPPADKDRVESLFFNEPGSDRLDDKCLAILHQAADGNPRMYLRMFNALRLVLSLAEHINPKLCVGTGKHWLTLATATSIRFPSLHELCGRMTEGLPTFMDYCANPQEPKHAEGLQTRGVDYLSFWKDGCTRQFFSGICKLGFRNTKYRETELMKAAFNLSCRVKTVTEVSEIS